MIWYICPAQGALQQGLEGRICDRCAWCGDASELQQLFGQRLGGTDGDGETAAAGGKNGGKTEGKQRNHGKMVEKWETWWINYG